MPKRMGWNMFPSVSIVFLFTSFFLTLSLFLLPMCVLVVVRGDDLTVVGTLDTEQQQQARELMLEVMARTLPDFWEQETNGTKIQEKRQKLLDEALGLKKFARMRKALEALRQKEMSREMVATPPNILLEVKLMEQVNRMSSIDNTQQQMLLTPTTTSSSMAIPAHQVPTPKHVNQPIEDMLYGGDMMLRDDQSEDMLADLLAKSAGEHLHARKMRQKRQVIKGRLFPMNQWATSQPISYTFDASISENTRRLVRLAVQFLQEHTCVSFQEDGPWIPRVRIFKGQGCYSEVGRDIFSREQQLSLGTGCELFGTITHEFSHVLGLYHHHSRTDRDDFINLIQENIEPSWRVQYAKAPADRSDNQGLPYDYGSNMHYGGTDSDSEKIIMAAKHKHYQHTMGNNIGPIFEDLLAINKYYNCIAKCSSGADCKNNGFRNSRDCQKCICPNGYGGDDCSERAAAENLAASGGECGQTVDAGDDYLELSGSITPQVATGRLLSDKSAACHFHIKAPDGKRVQIEMTNLNGTCTPECYFGAVEVKLSDFEKAGIRICCKKHMAEIGDKLVSDGQLAMVSIYSQRSERSFKLRYKSTTDSATKDDDLLGGSGAGGGASVGTSGSTSFSSLLQVLSSVFQQNNPQSNCVDKNQICTTDLGKLICTLPFYASTREQVCKKSCQLC